MDSVAILSQKERAELFEQTASRRGFHPAIAEKDFWVCWVLTIYFSCLPATTRPLLSMIRKCCRM